MPPPVAEDGADQGLPAIEPAGAYIAEGQPIRIRATEGDRLWLCTDNRLAGAVPGGSQAVIPAKADAQGIDRALATPTAIQWRHPLPGLPRAMVVRAAQSEGGRAPGTFAMRTYLFARHGLPVVSISLDPDDLLGEERGIAVPGNAILTLPKEQTKFYAKDPKWWKYPGNYHGRGKAWERACRWQLIDPDGSERCQGEARLRINGQMTRGFPQHAFRLLLEEPLGQGLFPDGDGAGTKALVLRAAGNDQVKAMLRDAYQHRLCEGQPFAISKALSCAVYINGAYQGVYHLRQRLDDKEIARRHGIRAKQVTILEDHNALYRGAYREVARFEQLVGATERWDARDPAWIDTLEARMDLDGYLRYMASQMILGNMDWPRQNVKYWRYMGRPEPGGVRDGRWRMIMGDSDLGFGAVAGPEADLFVKVRPAGMPVSRLLLAMMRNDGLRARFVRHGEELLDGALSTERCLAVLDSMSALLRPEMARHTARWRKPADAAAWEREVQAMRAYAMERPARARKQLQAYR